MSGRLTARNARENMREYKAISIKQPWANLIADGRKTLEVRSWKTKPRANVVICSSASPVIYPAGFALCVVDIVGCRPMTRGDEDAACVSFAPGANVWVLANVRRINPFPVKGGLGFFHINRNLHFTLSTFSDAQDYFHFGDATSNVRK